MARAEVAKAWAEHRDRLILKKPSTSVGLIPRRNGDHAQQSYLSPKAASASSVTIQPYIYLSGPNGFFDQNGATLDACGNSNCESGGSVWPGEELSATVQVVISYTTTAEEVPVTLEEYCNYSRAITTDTVTVDANQEESSSGGDEMVGSASWSFSATSDCPTSDTYGDTAFWNSYFV